MRLLFSDGKLIHTQIQGHRNQLRPPRRMIDQNHVPDPICLPIWPEQWQQDSFLTD